jgi:hypothetical protein
MSLYEISLTVDKNKKSYQVGSKISDLAQDLQDADLLVSTHYLEKQGKLNVT